MKRQQFPAWLSAMAVIISTASCCLETGTGIHGNSLGADAGADAGIDAGFDAGIDAGLDAGIVVGPCGPASDMNATATYFLPIPGGSGDAGLGVTTMASGDLNGDGLLDLVANVSNPEFQTDMDFYGGFAVLFGEPDGGLSAPTLYDGHGYSLSAVTLADVNGDGRLDLIIGDTAYAEPDLEPAVSVFLNDGDGGLTLAGSFWAIPWTKLANGSYEISFIAVADMNGDGRADLVLSQWLNPQTFPSNSVAEVLWGNADGGFDLPATIQDAAPSELGGMAVGDFNGDGIPDLASPGPEGGIAILLGLGDGGFDAHSLPYATDLATGVFLLPVAGEAPDLIVDTPDGFEGGSLTGVSQVLDNSGTGSFTDGPSYFAGGFEFAVGDFNGDCIPDIAWNRVWGSTEFDESYRLTVLYGSKGGGFGAPQTLKLLGSSPWGIAPLGPVAHPHALAVGDFSGAGITVYGDASRH